MAKSKKTDNDVGDGVIEFSYDVTKRNPVDYGYSATQYKSTLRMNGNSREFYFEYPEAIVGVVFSLVTDMIAAITDIDELRDKLSEFIFEGISDKINDMKEGRIEIGDQKKITKELVSQLLEIAEGVINSNGFPAKEK